MQQRGSAVALYQAAGKVLAFLGRRKKVVCESNINISLGFVQTLQHADHQDEMPGSQQHTRLPTPFLTHFFGSTFYPWCICSCFIVHADRGFLISSQNLSCIHPAGQTLEENEELPNKRGGIPVNHPQKDRECTGSVEEPGAMSSSIARSRNINISFKKKIVHLILILRSHRPRLVFTCALCSLVLCVASNINITFASTTTCVHCWSVCFLPCHFFFTFDAFVAGGVIMDQPYSLQQEGWDTTWTIDESKVILKQIDAVSVGTNSSPRSAVVIGSPARRCIGSRSTALSTSPRSIGRRRTRTWRATSRRSSRSS